MLLVTLAMTFGGMLNFSVVVGTSQGITLQAGGIVPTAGSLNISRPSNVGYELGETGNNITWLIDDTWGGYYSCSYKVLKDGVQISAGTEYSYDRNVTINVDGLAIGRHIYKFEVSGNGQTLTDEVAVTVVSSLKEARALVIGVNDYVNLGTDIDLGQCVNDATAMKNMLLDGGFSGDGIEFLTNTQATDVNILNRISTIGQDLEADDTFALFYSGHGTRDFNDTEQFSATITTGPSYSNGHLYADYWSISCPGAYAMRVKFTNFRTESGYDYVYVTNSTDFGPPEYTGSRGNFWSGWIMGDEARVHLVTDGSIVYYGFDVFTYEVAYSSEESACMVPTDLGTFSGTRLDTALDSLLTTDQYLFFDSCYSGGFLETLPKTGRAVMTACNSTELSWESGTLQHGWFTYYAMQSFAKSGTQYLRDSNSDGKVSIQEIYNYVNASTVAYAQSQGESQHPLLSNQISGSGVWDFDTDDDGLFDWEEVNAGSSISVADTDGDLLSDYDEVKTYLTDPYKTDTDDDGLSDYLEIFSSDTDPNDADSDDDGFTDGSDWSPNDPTQPGVTIGLLIFAGVSVLVGMGYVKYKKAHPTPRYVPSYTPYAQRIVPTFQTSSTPGAIGTFATQPTYQGLNADQWGELASKLHAQGRQQEAVVAMTVSRTLRENPARLGGTAPQAQPTPEPAPASVTYSTSLVPDSTPLQDPTPVKAPSAPATPDISSATPVASPATPPVVVETPSAVPTTPVPREDWFTTGRSFFKLGQLEQAEQAFRELLRYEPNNPEAWFYLGLVLQGQKQDRAASEAFQSAMEKNLDEPQAWAGVGFMLAGTDRKDEARSAFELALQLAPSDWPDRARVTNARAGLLSDSSQEVTKTPESQPPALQPVPSEFSDSGQTPETLIPPERHLHSIPEISAPKVPTPKIPPEDRPHEAPVTPTPHSEPPAPASPPAPAIAPPTPSPSSGVATPAKVCELCQGIVKDGVCEKCGGKVCPHCKEMNFSRNINCAYCSKSL